MPSGRFWSVAAALGLALAAGCSARRERLPDWVETPPADDTHLYAVGVRTAAPTLEEARRAAVEQAVGELVRRFGVTSESRFREVRTQLETEVRDEVRSRSGPVRIDGTIVDEWYLRQSPAGYDAFVLLRYPRQRAERERARLAALDAAALHAAAQAARRGDEARDRGDLGAAIPAYLDAAARAGESAAGAALRISVLSRLSAIATGLSLDVVSGDAQLARPLAPLREPLRLRAWLGARPAAGLPLRLSPSNTVVASAGGVRTDENGAAALTIERVRTLPADLSFRVEPDAAALRPRGMALDGASDAVLRAIASRGVTFHLLAERARRPVRVAVLIDERRGGVRRRRALLAAALGERLNRAGFRLVADHELGKTNLELMRTTVDVRQLLSVDPRLVDAVDVVVAGWCETRWGSENRGWATSALADAEVKAVDVATGEVLAASGLIGRAGFGEGADRAEVDAVRAVADALAEELTVQLAGEADTWSAEVIDADEGQP